MHQCLKLSMQPHFLRSIWEVPLSIDESDVSVTGVPSVLLYASANSGVPKLPIECVTTGDGIKGIEPLSVCKSAIAEKEPFSARD